MEAPGNVYERLCLAYDTRIVELKAEFFRRVAKLIQYSKELEDVSVPNFSEICGFLRDTYELAQADYEAAIATGIWQLPAFTELFAKVLERALQHAEKLLVRHLKAKNLGGVASVLRFLTPLPASIDLTKVFFHSALELLSEDYEETLFESSDDAFIEQLSQYSLHRAHLWKLGSCRTAGSRWLMYECDQSCYQGDFYEQCFPGLYRALLSQIFHTHAAHRSCMHTGSQAAGDCYAFTIIAGEIVQAQVVALSRRKPSASSVLKSLTSFSSAREQVALESSRSASVVLTPAYYSFLTLLQTATHYYAKDITVNAQGDSTILKLMLIYANISELLYCFFGLLAEPRPYVERLVTDYEMEWQRDSLVAARDNELPASINWLRYLRCIALDSFRARIQTTVAIICSSSLSPTAYDISAEAPDPRGFVRPIIDLLTGLYEQSSFIGKPNRVMIRKTLAVFVSVAFKELRARVREICTALSPAGVSRLAKDISMVLDAVCELTVVRCKAGYSEKVKGLREVQKWRGVLVSLLTADCERPAEEHRQWRAKMRGQRGDRLPFPDVTLLQMQVLT